MTVLLETAYTTAWSFIQHPLGCCYIHMYLCGYGLPMHNNLCNKYLYDSNERKICAPNQLNELTQCIILVFFFLIRANVSHKEKLLLGVRRFPVYYLY